jgi:hypothetical protein
MDVDKCIYFKDLPRWITAFVVLLAFFLCYAILQGYNLGSIQHPPARRHTLHTNHPDNSKVTLISDGSQHILQPIILLSRRLLKRLFRSPSQERNSICK